jgi:hypothetical protein
MYKCKCGKEFKTQGQCLGHQGRCLIHRNAIEQLLSEEFLYKEYIVEKHSIPELSQQTGVSIATIHRRLVKLGINRSIEESCTVSNKQTKSRNTQIAKYGSPHNFCKSHPSRIKWQERLKEQEGITNVFQREDVKNKIRNSLLQNYGVENPALITTSRGKNSYSSIHKELVDELIKLEIIIKIEKKIAKRNGYYWLFDIFIQPDLLVEMNGDYWHGNPRIYKDTDLILKGSSKEQTVKDKRYQDTLKYQAAKEAGYRVLVIWEYDWKTNKENEIRRILDAIPKDI